MAAAMQSDDAGLSLIEAVAALAIAALILTGLAYAAVGGIRGSTEARINQQAADVLESTLETARTQSYDSVVMWSSDPDLSTAKDSRILTSGCPNGGSMCISLPNPSGGSPVKESLVTSSAAGFQTDHLQTVTNGTNNVPFKVATYVTTPSDETAATYKRVTVFVTWTNFGQTHTRVGSTYVTSTVRGLPLPRFSLSPAVGAPTNTTANPGATVVFGLTLQNLGARDAFDITSSDNTLAWTYYADTIEPGKTQPSGDYDPAPNPAAAESAGNVGDLYLVDNDGDGIRDTGLVDTNNSSTFWMVGTIPANATPGHVYTNTVTATSVAQPNLGAGISTQTQTLTVTVQTIVTSSPTPTVTTSTTTSSSPSPSPSPTTTTASPSPTATATTPNPCATIINSAAPSTGWLGYLHATKVLNQTAPTSANVTSTSLGVNSSPTFDKNDGYNGNNANVLEWDLQWTTTTNPSIHGPAYVTLWVNSSSSVKLQAMIGLGSAGNGNGNGNGSISWSQISTGTNTVTGTGCGNWQEIVIPVTITTTVIKNNNKIQILVFNTGSSSVNLSYDTAVSAYGLSGSYVPSAVTFSGGIS